MSDSSHLYNNVRGCLNDRDGMTFNSARGALDELFRRLTAAEAALKEVQALADQILVAAWQKPSDG